ncbi:hypothetical protein FAZ95_30065 [Trinickia violacea]|uniref:DUF4148 domain-containing protein n=1 Tax=Trinickia violacea TaxID=2571746 RepID=A0A4V1EIC7_9BURK|nr:hypothetical protein [Trinickia violacea]QCP53310.1 hypothetical protein FAZ95_30065 [Trinickia violacea]
MNMLRLAAVATIALIGTGAWAQELTPEQAQIQAAQFSTTESASQDVGGVEPGVGGGAPQRVTRQQVYQDLIHSEKSGQLQMIQNSVFRGQ